jgi:hypothetical protein
MRLTATAFVTSDGVMQSPGAPQEDPRNDFELGGWLPPYFDNQLGVHERGVRPRRRTLLGRFTYGRWLVTGQRH